MFYSVRHVSCPTVAYLLMYENALLGYHFCIHFQYAHLHDCLQLYRGKDEQDINVNHLTTFPLPISPSCKIYVCDEADIFVEPNLAQ